MASIEHILEEYHRRSERDSPSSHRATEYRADYEETQARADADENGVRRTRKVLTPLIEPP
jgi:hypothetical protein